jgi:transcription initiation factor IIE alpha subunit
MGIQYKYRCKKCEYEVMTSGTHDSGMLAVTDTFICKSCNEIVDVTIGEFGQTYTKEEIALKKIKSVNDLDFYQCPNCGSETSLVKWNNKKRPCPKCYGKMDKDTNGEIILWD